MAEAGDGQPRRARFWLYLLGLFVSALAMGASAVGGVPAGVFVSLIAVGVWWGFINDELRRERSMRTTRRGHDA